MKKVTFSTSILLFLTLAIPSLTLFAAEHEVQMKNSGSDGFMVFEPGFLKVEPGDTVKFIPTDSGHNSASESIPDGGTTWNGATNAPVSVTLNQEGVYIYKCTPHIVAGMVGVIQVGKPVNLESAKKDAKTLGAALASGKERLEKFMGMIEP